MEEILKRYKSSINNGKRSGSLLRNSHTEESSYNLPERRSSIYRSGLNQFALGFSSNMLRNTSHSFAFPRSKRPSRQLMNGMPYYHVNLSVVARRSPSPAFNRGGSYDWVQGAPSSGPSPGSYNFSSPFSAQKRVNYCAFGKRSSSLMEIAGRESPGPGNYYIDSFVDSIKRNNFHNAKKYSYASKYSKRSSSPGPDQYSKNYNQVEPQRQIRFPHVLCVDTCLLYTSPSPRDLSTSRMPSSA
eukprot:TRINITY_DN31612_c0_g1_i1.p1 TRINITY_DN31612_c0_g1~~TRINITY_DN31612_c0_g1_i1.p1  ORF type:complete len:243 (-),score=10.03 TRINITY_DN31612_c0_g1_i1:60-788(-)